MYRRKLYGFLITSLLTSIVLTILTMFDLYLVESGLFNKIVWTLEIFFFILFFGTPFIFILGVPVSLLSDFLTYLLLGIYRTLFALIIHVGIGYIIGVTLVSILEGLMYLWASIIASTIFWFIDEVLRKRMNNNYNIPIHYNM